MREEGEARVGKLEAWQQFCGEIMGTCPRKMARGRGWGERKSQTHGDVMGHLRLGEGPQQGEQRGQQGKARGLG